MDFTCLENIIGLSERDCSCFTTQPAEWSTMNASTSGYYLDNYEWTVPLSQNIYDNCDGETIWTIYDKVRLDGLKDLINHLLMVLPDYQTQSFSTIKDIIGDPKKTNTAFTSLSDDWVGLIIEPKFCKSTILYIKEIKLKLDTTGSIDVKLIDGIDNSELETVSVSAVADTLVSQTVDWKVELIGEPKTLYLVYDRGSALPYNYEISCGCGGSKPGYLKQMNVKGMASDATFATISKSGYTYGLLVDFTYQCDPLNWLCYEINEFWTSNQFGMLFSKLYQMYASMKLNLWLLNQSSLSPYTLVEKEKLFGINNTIQKHLNQLVPKLATMIPETASDCFSCRTTHGARISENLVI